MTDRRQPHTVIGPPSSPAFTGWPVVIYDGTNAAEIVAALRLAEGDAVVTPAGQRPIVVKAAAIDKVGDVVADGHVDPYGEP